MTEKELRRIAANVRVRRGWDFSRMREAQEPAPWGYADVARKYLTPLIAMFSTSEQAGENAFLR